MTPTSHPATQVSSAAQLAALLQGACITALADIGWLRITGADRVRWLNGMSTNSIQQLAPGEGNYNFFLNAQGRIQGDANIFTQPDALLVETAAAQLPALISLLDRFIIMDDVELADITGTQLGIAITGPEAARFLEQIGISSAQLKEFEMQATLWHAAEVTVIHAHSPLVPHFELWSDAETIAALTQTLLAAGATPCNAEAPEWLRLLEGTPRYGTDIRDRDLPQETAPIGIQSRALHFSKGCYLGQEIVERIRSRGNVHRAFSAFRLEGSLPPAGTSLDAEGKPVGELTSVASIPLPEGPVQLALGYIRREALDRNATLHYPGGTATPSPIPYTAEARKPEPASEPKRV